MGSECWLFSSLKKYVSIAISRKNILLIEFQLHKKMVPNSFHPQKIFNYGKNFDLTKKKWNLKLLVITLMGIFAKGSSSSSSSSKYSSESLSAVESTSMSKSLPSSKGCKKVNKHLILQLPLSKKKENKQLNIPYLSH